MIDDEIDLLECIIVVVKRWKLVVGITVLFAIMSVVYSFLKPNVYQSTAVIGPAKIQKSNIESAASTLILLKNLQSPYISRLASVLDIQKENSSALLSSFEIEEKADYFIITGRGNFPEKARRLVSEVSAIVLERQNSIMKDALKIIENEMADLKEQISSITDEITTLDKKIYSKEKTENLAQSYVFQGLIESKENASKRRMDLMKKLREKEMEIKYFTTLASVIVPASLPEKKIAPRRAKIIIIVVTIGIIFSIFTVFIIEYVKKNLSLTTKEIK